MNEVFLAENCLKTPRISILQVFFNNVWYISHNKNIGFCCIFLYFMSFISNKQFNMINFKFPSLFLVLLILTSLNSCGLYKRSDVKDNPVNADERVRKNIQEGRGIRFG